ncbi:MAG: SsrA-binding protein SmpB [Candidatus Pacebacteria bacterium]|jgi:SsrA-binding protein|nr:SsrA-binding protein SmpB [Candidatus Paceibacterota bacterium]
MKLVENKKLRLVYEVMDTYTAGIELVGHEVKALRQKLGSLEGSKVIIRGGEAFLVGSYIPPYQAANTPASYDEHRTRRLLLNKKEIAELLHQEEVRGLTVHPISLYIKNNLVKCDIALCKKLQKHDKREKVKQEISRREMRLRE